MDQWVKDVRARGAQPTGAEIRPAATVALLRDSERGLEVLMGKRSSKLAFHGGSWVFPGGRIDAGDWGDDDDVLAAARRAAARETEEEAGLVVAADSLVHLSNWTTPEISPKRFATWFFVADAGAETAHAKADGIESDAVRWFTAPEAFAARREGEIEIAPPQFVTLLSLQRFATVATAIESLPAEAPFHFEPRFKFLEGAAVCIYEGDVAYDDPEQHELPGPRHRLLMPGDADWVYEDSRT